MSPQRSDLTTLAWSRNATLLILLVAAAVLASPLLTRAAARPNIVVILADDMGFSDVGCYGGEVETPHLDRLAANGLRFTQFYNTARCCPTRASLLTGLYPHQAGVPHMVDNSRLPLEQRQLSRNAVTIAEVLRANGYHTAMSGKWHVCPVDSYRTNGPLARGFERFYGMVHGAASYYEPVTLMRDEERITDLPAGFFLTDAIAESAARYIHELARQPKPFFLYAAFTAPHWPLHAPKEDSDKYVERYRRGWDVLRAERHRRQVELGILEDLPLPPRDSEVKAWNEVPSREWEAQRMAVYAAQIERMDRGVGQIVQALRDTGSLDNTLILFLSDNGACAENLGPKMNALHVPKAAPDGGPMRLGNSPEIVPGGADTYASYGKPWAHLSNTPFRTYKHWVHEGGIATPLIAHWPQRIRNPGLRKEPGHLIDIMATCVDVAQARYPREFAGHSIQPLEGRSLEPVFRGRSLGARPLFFEHEANRAVRFGEWKLVSRYPGDWELYQISRDRGEQTNLALADPKRVQAMAERFEDWARRVGVPAAERVATQPAVRATAGRPEAGSRAAISPNHPNILLVMTDDQGYGDLSFTGNPILKTPNLDAFARESVRFTAFHVSPTCAPTRSALMTGRHEFKNGVTHTIYERERLTLKATTIAEVLRKAGYTTGIFGKWHLGDEAEYRPDRRGFDEVFIHGAGGIGQTYAGSCGDAPTNSYFNPAILHNGRFERTTGYCTDVFFCQASRWIDAQRQAGKPFFAYITPNAPHAPLDCPEEYFRQYRDKVPENPAKFFGMIANIDDNFGALMRQVDAWGLATNTLVIFMTDNGGTAGTKIYNAGMRASKGTPYEGGTRVPAFWRWPAAFSGGVDCPALAAHIDIFPTLCEIVGVKLTDALARQVEGRSLLPLLRDPRAPWADRFLVTHVGRWKRGAAAEAKFVQCAIRNTRFALVNNNELYDLEADFGQQNNVLQDHPEVVASLRSQYDKWWSEALPLLVNEGAVGPKVNPFKALYWEQFGGGPDEALARKMDPAHDPEAGGKTPGK
jgi:arylsulfatase